MGNNLVLGPQYEDEDEETQKLQLHDEIKRAKGKGILDDDLDDLISNTRTKTSTLFNNKSAAGVQSKVYLVIIITVIFIFAVFSSSISRKSSDKEIDYSSVMNTNQLELKLGEIHHWCINGDDNSCTCDDPLTARSGVGKDWFEAHDDNAFQVESYISRVPSQDVVFVGDDIAELWAGGRGTGKSLYKAKIRKIFSSLFERTSNGPIDGLSLGISGDTVTNLLWRIKNGELPGDLNPKIWWILTGLNDIRAKGCSAEVIAMSVIRLVEEIQSKKPGSKIIINAILPSAGNEGFGPKAWATAKQVNRELFKFSKFHEIVEFFDPSPSFIDMDKLKNGNKNSVPLNKELYNNEMNLSVYGHELLLEKIHKKVMVMLVN